MPLPATTSTLRRVAKWGHPLADDGDSLSASPPNMGSSFLLRATRLRWPRQKQTDLDPNLPCLLAPRLSQLLWPVYSVQQPAGLCVYIYTRVYSRCYVPCASHRLPPVQPEEAPAATTSFYLEKKPNFLFLAHFPSPAIPPPRSTNTSSVLYGIPTVGRALLNTLPTTIALHNAQIVHVLGLETHPESLLEGLAPPNPGSSSSACDDVNLVVVCSDHPCSSSSLRHCREVQLRRRRRRLRKVLLDVVGDRPPTLRLLSGAGLLNVRHRQRRCERRHRQSPAPAR